MCDPSRRACAGCGDPRKPHRAFRESDRSGGDLTACLYDGDTCIQKQPVIDGKADFTVSDAKPWSAEVPNLYTLVLEGFGEFIPVPVGFRTIAISPKGELLINGVSVQLKGVNHHDTDPVKRPCHEP